MSRDIPFRVQGPTPAPVAVGYRSTAANQTLTNATFTTLDLAGTPNHDLGGGFTKSSNVVTVVNQGVYSLTGFASFNVATGNCRNILRVETFIGGDPGVGGATIIAASEMFGNAVSSNALVCGTQNFFIAGQKLRVIGWQNQGTSNTVLSATLLTQLNIARVA